MADVSIKYRNAEIANMSASGSKTLQTAGKYCDDDITVDYVKPSGGGGNFAHGTITPASRTTSLTFDTGLSNVTGVAITPTSETPLLSGGLTTGGGVFTTDTYYHNMSSRSNSAGASWNNVNASTADTTITQNGTIVTVANRSNWGAFEAIEYSWFAWGV